MDVGTVVAGIFNRFFILKSMAFRNVQMFFLDLNFISIKICPKKSKKKLSPGSGNNVTVAEIENHCGSFLLKFSPPFRGS
jgi:hypothetical protein